MYDIVAQRLRLFLAKKDITCKKLSAMIFMSEATLKGKLNGTRTLDLNTIISIAIRLEDLSVEWLLRGEGDMLKSSSGVSIVSSSVPIFTPEMPITLVSVNEYKSRLQQMEVRLEALRAQVVLKDKLLAGLLRKVENKTK